MFFKIKMLSIKFFNFSTCELFAWVQQVNIIAVYNNQFHCYTRRYCLYVPQNDITENCSEVLESQQHLSRLTVIIMNNGTKNCNIK